MEARAPVHSEVDRNVSVELPDLDVSRWRKGLWRQAGGDLGLAQNHVEANAWSR
jgi:hypothetical protein